MIDRLHYITQEGPNGESHAQMVRRACEAGVRWVQLRIKNVTQEAVIEQAETCLATCNEFEARLILNDHVEVAEKVPVHGVHIGKADMDPAEARKIVGGRIIGGTANTFEDIVTLEKKGVDYVGLGPYRFTTTKEKLSPILGLEGYQAIFRQMELKGIKIPVIAIGGLQPDDLSGLRGAGAHGVAIASLINRADDPQKTVKQLMNALYEEFTNSRQDI